MLAMSDVAFSVARKWLDFLRFFLHLFKVSTYPMRSYPHPSNVSSCPGRGEIAKMSMCIVGISSRNCSCTLPLNSSLSCWQPKCNLPSYSLETRTKTQFKVYKIFWHTETKLFLTFVWYNSYILYYYFQLHTILLYNFLTAALLN